ncbi:homeobox protein SIX5-like [Oryctolagus cuniculus]|uniref:homeobox protein SIX5-like n=1 Tax=Oryctolagus cuniculus TaxID=9986 RepID=UPI0038780A14
MQQGKIILTATFPTSMLLSQVLPPTPGLALPVKLEAAIPVPKDTLPAQPPPPVATPPFAADSSSLAQFPSAPARDAAAVPGSRAPLAPGTGTEHRRRVAAGCGKGAGGAGPPDRAVAARPQPQRPAPGSPGGERGGPGTGGRGQGPDPAAVGARGGALGTVTNTAPGRS